MFDQLSPETMSFPKNTTKEQMLFFACEYTTIKNHSFFAVAEHPGLTCKQIFLVVRKTSAKSVSMQGVHKAVKQLESAQVLKKINKKYFINTEWIDQTKSYLELASTKLNQTDSDTELLIVEVPTQNKNKPQLDNRFRNPLNHLTTQAPLF
ncbi:MAG: hypothetical protein WCW44_01995 [archaeon]|jgi:hypothetical protein